MTIRLKNTACLKKKNFTLVQAAAYDTQAFVIRAGLKINVLYWIQYLQFPSNKSVYSFT